MWCCLFIGNEDLEMTAPANHYSPGKRTLSQVKKFLAKCARNGSDKSAASLLATHGNLEDDAMAYVVSYASA